MENNERKTARAQLVTAMLAGQSWQQAAATAMPVKRAMAYRLVRAVRTRGEEALQDERHGHPSKLRGEAGTWVETYCRGAPQTPSWQVQVALKERFQLSVSISQINRLRAALGVGNHSGKAGKYLAQMAPTLTDSQWHEGAGGLLLLATAHQSHLLAHLETALDTLMPVSGSRLARTRVLTRRSLLLTLLFLAVAGLRRTWDLRSYTGDGLALLAGRRQMYGYRHPERFLTEVAQAGGAEPLTEALAKWTAHLWQPSLCLPGSLPPAYYIDGHRKAVWSQTLIPPWIGGAARRSVRVPGIGAAA